MKPIYPVELEASDGQHFYKVGENGTLWPGVTTVLKVLDKPFLVPWAAKMTADHISAYLKKNALGRPLTASEIDQLVYAGKKSHSSLKEEAADVGTRAHNYVDSIVLGLSIVEPEDDIKPPVQAFKDFCEQYKPLWILGDSKVASKRYGFGGSLDAVADIGGKRYIMDFKTSNRLQNSYAYQVGAYSIAFTETYGETVDGGLVLRLDKNKPVYEVKRVYDLTMKEADFLSILKVYDALKKQAFEEFV